MSEFGHKCLLYSLEEVLRYGGVINILQANEKDRIVERKEVSLFNNDAFREAIVNAFLHNRWVDGNEPMITIFSDKIEILSRSPLSKNQTLEGFYSGESIPVNPKLSEIFLQLHISEKTGRGVPKIIKMYGKNAFEFRKQSIVVKIKFNWINELRANKKDDSHSSNLSDTQAKILENIRDNPNITKSQIQLSLSKGKTTVDNSLTYLKNNGYIECVGSRKSGYWKVLL